MKEPLHIGILYPAHAAEDDYPRFAAMLVPPAEVHIAHTETVDVHKIDACIETGSRERLLPGVTLLQAHSVAVCMFACTSASFVMGVAGAQRQAQDIVDALGVPSSSTSLAFLSGIRALGLTRVAVAASYPEDVANAFRAFLVEDGIEVVRLSRMDIWTGGEAGYVKREALLRFVSANDHSDAEAVLIPDTALHTAAFLPELEACVGKTVLTANQVTMWEALRLADCLAPQANLGRLMTVAQSKENVQSVLRNSD